MKYGWIVATLGVALLLTLAISHDITGQSAKSEATYVDYEGVNISSREDKAKLVGMSIRVKDYFGSDLRRPPEELERYFPRSRFVAFRSQDSKESNPGLTTAPGSNLICVIPRSNTEALQELGKLVGGDQILMHGKIVVPIGLNYAFAVEKLQRGWEVDEGVVITVSQPNSVQKRNYRLSKPGQTYRIFSPYDNKPIYISYQKQ